MRNKSNRLIMLLMMVGLATFSFHMSVSAENNKEKNSTVPSEAELEETKQSAEDAITDDALYTYDEPEVEETNYTWIIFRTLFVLGLLMAGFYFFFKFIMKQNGIPLGSRAGMKTVAVMPLGQSKSLQIVELGSKLMVLGVSDSNITLIKEVTERDEIDRIKLQSSSEVEAPSGGFQEYLTKQIGQFVSFVNNSSNPHYLAEQRKKALEKKRAQEPSDFVSLNPEAEPNNSEEKQKRDFFDKAATERRSFFDDENFDYLKKQKSRLREISGYRDEE